MRPREISERVGPSNLAEDCEARFLWQRLEGYEEVKESQAFGTVVHAVLQAYFERASDVPARACEILNEDAAKMGTAEQALVEPHWQALALAGWMSKPGQCAQAGLHLLPNPADCLAIWPEQEITLAPHPDAGPGARPIEGTRDLLVRTTSAEFERLKIMGSVAAAREAYATANGWLVVDFKTSVAPERYAKTPEALFTDTQGVCYPLAVLRDFGSAFQAIPCAWTYFPSRSLSSKDARRVDFMQTAANAEARHRELSLRAQEIRELVRLRADPREKRYQNPAACGNYGGCKLHASRGGPCDATEDFGASANALIKPPKRNETTEETMTAKPLSFAEKRAQQQRQAASAAPTAPAQTPAPAADHSAAYAKVKAKVQAGYDESAANELIDMLTDGAFKTFVDAANVYDPEPAPAEEPAPAAPMQSVAETQGEPPAAAKKGRAPKAAAPAPSAAPQVTGSVAGMIADAVRTIRELTGCTSVELKF
jgi:hypothetical protein